MKLHRTVRPALLAVFPSALVLNLGSVALGQGCVNWTPVAAPGGPGPGEWASIAVDPVRRVLVLVDGANLPGQTWEFDGSVWALRCSASVLSTAGDPLVFDEAHGVMLLFKAGRIPIEWNPAAGTWQTRPAGPAGMRVVYDRARSRFVGYASTTSATYAYDGATWTQLATTGPAPRIQCSMAYDIDRDRIVLTGGQPPNSPGSYFNDTWEFDGTTWQMRASSLGPDHITDLSNELVYDASRHRTLAVGATSDRTWQWDGIAWVQVAAAGPTPTRTFFSLAYDPGAGRVLLLGGNTGLPSMDIWTIAPVFPNIVRQPAAIAATQGGGATFAVQCTGLVQSYQWRKNQAPIPGAIYAVYHIPSVSSADAGVYDVQVTGGCSNTQTSAPAALTVRCAPDMDNNGSLNVLDFVGFLNSFAAGCS